MLSANPSQYIHHNYRAITVVCVVSRKSLGCFRDNIHFFTSMLVHTGKYTTGIKVMSKSFGFLALRMSSAPTYLSISGINISTAQFICWVHLSLPPVQYTHTMHFWRNPPPPQARFGGHQVLWSQRPSDRVSPPRPTPRNTLIQWFTAYFSYHNLCV
jgi:hypothetical protein